MPEGWADKPAKRAQKDVEARWTKKHGKSHYGYKNHVNVDRRHKLVRRYHVTDAALHDSQAVDQLLMLGNTGAGSLGGFSLSVRGHGGQAGDRPEAEEPHPSQGQARQAMTEQAKKSNRTKSTARVRVEHVFGAQANDMGGTLVRIDIGMTAGP